MSPYFADWKQPIGGLNIPYLLRHTQKLDIFPLKKIPVYLILITVCNGCVVMRHQAGKWKVVGLNLSDLARREINIAFGFNIIY